MDGREGITLPGSASYYLNRGGIGGSGVPGHGGGGSGGAPAGGMSTPPGFKAQPNPNIHMHPNVGGAMGGLAFNVENPSPGFVQGMNMSIVPSASQGGETMKKKRGRPRKYVPDGANVSLALSPLAASNPSAETAAKGEKRRGRPPGTGWKQKLAPLGEWMNSSAGQAFTPHVLHVAAGEDIAAKILAFAQQRQRALCIMSGSGSVSVVTLRQPTNSSGTITYEGRFEILCLSGSYLVSETGGPRNRTGGISISVCNPEGQMIGGAIGGRLIAANAVQVVACSFVYGNNLKAKTRPESEENYTMEQSAEKPSTGGADPANVWPRQADFDLTRG